mgnify:FL=1|tara:strand:+ start:114 stop:569 length:456 start_codon:yes stop_codon:yes gene_type:complete
MEYSLIHLRFQEYLVEAEIKYDEFVGDKYIIDLDSLSVVASKHAEERSRRHIGQRGKGGARAGKISRDSVRRALDRALPDILDDFANGELDNKEAFHVKAEQGNQPALNVIGKLDMRKGPDKMVLITMMRKDDFRTDAFGDGSQKTYEVSI